MDANKVVIVWLSIQILGLSVFVTRQAYELGYERGRIHELTTWTNEPEGYCLAEGGHPGPCKEEIPNVTNKRTTRSRK